MRHAAVAPLLLQLAVAFPKLHLYPRQAANLIDSVVGNITQTGVDTTSINNTLNSFAPDATDIGFNAIALLGGSTNVQKDLNLTAFSANQSSPFSASDSGRIVTAVEGILPATFDTLNNFVAHCRAFLNTNLSNAVLQQLQIQRELAREESDAIAAKLDSSYSDTASVGVSAILSVFDSAISVFSMTVCPTNQVSAVPPTAPGGTTSTPATTTPVTSTPSSTPVKTSTPVSTPVTSSTPVKTSTPVTSSAPVKTSTPVTSSTPIITSTPVSTPVTSSTPCPESSTPVVPPAPGTTTVTQIQTTTVEKTQPAQTVTVTSTVEKTQPAQTVTVTSTVEKTQPAQTVTVTAGGAPPPYGYGSGHKTVTHTKTVVKTAPCVTATAPPSPYGYGQGGHEGHEGGQQWGWPWGHGW